MSIHPALQAVSELIGTFRGAGRGDYPTIEAFTYQEEVTFAAVGKPFLVYTQRTVDEAGAPLHTETGFLRVVDGRRVELVLAQPTGHSELLEGELTATENGFECRLEGTVVNSATAKRVDATTRYYRLDGETLSCEFAMAAVGQPMCEHLQSELHKEEP